MAQLELIVEELDAALRPSEQPAPTADAPAKDKPVRKPLPEQLPRITQEHAPAWGCPHSGTALRRMGEDVLEHLEYVPDHFKVIRTVRPKMSCPKCSAVVQEPAPGRPIPKSIAGAGLLARDAAGDRGRL